MIGACGILFVFGEGFCGSTSTVGGSHETQVRAASGEVLMGSEASLRERRCRSSESETLLKIELKSLILAQIERWRHALHMQVERAGGNSGQWRTGE